RRAQAVSKSTVTAPAKALAEAVAIDKQPVLHTSYYRRCAVSAGIHSIPAEFPASLGDRWLSSGG
ncbi:hypothetical protein, partial [Mesorhizobium sp.]|uniref:hypothetical protein n=1 Tax=Mesorhizobium sp. TaxID=1871066 RepID=UPI0025EC095A